MASPEPNILIDTSKWKVQCVQVEDGQHYIRVVGANGKIIMHGETLKNATYAKALAHKLCLRFDCGFVYKAWKP